MIDLGGLAAPVVVSWAQRYQLESASFDHAWVDVRLPDDSNPTRLFEWQDATMTVTVGNPGSTINQSAGWGVFSADGDWSDPGEQIFTDQPLAAGVNNLVFAVPPAALPFADIYARSRRVAVGAALAVSCHPSVVSGLRSSRRHPP